MIPEQEYFKRHFHLPKSTCPLEGFLTGPVSSPSCSKIKQVQVALSSLLVVEFIHIKWFVRAEWHYRILHTFVILRIQICTYSHTKQLCLGIWYFFSPKVANFIIRWCEYLSLEPVTFPMDICHCLWMELSINWWLDRWFGEHWDLVRSGPHQLFLFSLSHRQEYRASHHDITIFHSTFYF